MSTRLCLYFTEGFRYMMCSLHAEGMLCMFYNVCICLCAVYGVFMLKSHFVTCKVVCHVHDVFMIWSCCDLLMSVTCVVFMLWSCCDL